MTIPPLFFIVKLANLNLIITLEVIFLPIALSLLNPQFNWRFIVQKTVIQLHDGNLRVGLSAAAAILSALSAA